MALPDTWTAAGEEGPWGIRGTNGSYVDVNASCHHHPQVGCALGHHLPPVPLGLSSLEWVPTTPLPATPALRSSSIPGMDRMPVSPVAQRPPSQRRARTPVSVGDRGECFRYVLWQWGSRAGCTSRILHVNQELLWFTVQFSSGVT